MKSFWIWLVMAYHDVGIGSIAILELWEKTSEWCGIRWLALRKANIFDETTLDIGDCTWNHHKVIYTTFNPEVHIRSKLPERRYYENVSMGWQTVRLENPQKDLTYLNIGPYGLVNTLSVNWNCWSRLKRALGWSFDKKTSDPPQCVILEISAYGPYWMKRL